MNGRVVPNVDQAVALLRDFFFARTDRVAFLGPWGNPHPTMPPSDLESLLQSHVAGEQAAKAVVHYTSKRKGGHKVINGWFRVGSYVPAEDGSTPWLCVDFDAGVDHADALADPDEAVAAAYRSFSQHNLPAYLERSGGGKGWHLWCFFESGIAATKARRLARQLLPTDLPLAKGGIADHKSNKGIEIFPKQDRLGKNGTGNLVWLPWWSGAKENGNQFYRLDDEGKFTPFLPDAFEQVDESTISKVIEVTSEEESKHVEPKKKKQSEANNDWQAWRREALAALRLEDIYGELLTGKMSGEGWYECRDPASPSGDQNPSAGVSDGSNSIERGSFHSFITGETISVFDFLVKQGKAASMKDAIKTIADLTGVPLPQNTSRKQVDPTRTSLPEIQVNLRQVRDIIEDAWNAIRLLNEQKDDSCRIQPFLFRRGKFLVRLTHDDTERLQIEPMDEAANYGVLLRTANWVRVTSEGQVNAAPPKDVARDMPAFPDKKLPRIDSVISTPVFGSNGQLIRESGYHPEEKLWYQPEGQPLDLDIPSNPTNEHIEQARTLFLDEVLVDFPFKTQSDLAHMVAAMVLPFSRRLIKGCTPIHLVEAPTSGSGKGLLCSIVSEIALGHSVDARTLPTHEDEARKMITAELSRGRTIILLDNNSDKRRLDSPPLASVLTTETWSDRLLGKTMMLELPNRAMWMITGNNPKLTMEIARRCLRIRLQPEVDQPWLRDQFKHKKLIDWVREHRSELVQAILVMIQAWIMKGKPAFSKRLGSFEHWTEVIGGILQNAGITGFLDNLNDLYQEADEETRVWRRFTVAWWDEFQDEPKRASELNEFCEARELLTAIRGDKSTKSQQIRLGKALGRNRDRVFNNLRLIRVNEDSKRNGMSYALVLVNTDKDDHSRSNGKGTSDQMGMFAEKGECSGNVSEEHSHASNPVLERCSEDGGNVGNVSGILHARDHAPAQYNARTHAHEANPAQNIPHIPTNGGKPHQNSGSRMGMCEDNIPTTFPNIPKSQELDLANLSGESDQEDDSGIPF